MHIALFSIVYSIFKINLAAQEVTTFSKVPSGWMQTHYRGESHPKTNLIYAIPANVHCALVINSRMNKFLYTIKQGY